METRWSVYLKGAADKRIEMLCRALDRGAYVDVRPDGVVIWPPAGAEPHQWSVAFAAMLSAAGYDVDAVPASLTAEQRDRMVRALQDALAWLMLDA